MPRERGCIHADGPLALKEKPHAGSVLFPLMKATTCVCTVVCQAKQQDMAFRLRVARMGLGFRV
jgi:hypothetical protein